MTCLEGVESVTRSVVLDPGAYTDIFAGGQKWDEYGFVTTVLVIGYQINFLSLNTGATGGSGEFWFGILRVDSGIPVQAAASTTTQAAFPMTDTIGMSNVFKFNSTSTESKYNLITSPAVFFPKDQGKQVNFNQVVSLYACSGATTGATSYVVIWSLFWVPLIGTPTV